MSEPTDLDAAMIAGLTEDADRDRATVREWDETLPSLPSEPPMTPENPKSLPPSPDAPRPSDWYFPPTQDDLEWMRRYPGSFGGPLSEARACWICGEPGYTVPAPPEPITLASIDTLPDPTMRRGDTCPGHEYATRRFLAEHPEFPSLVSKGWRWR